MSIKNKRYKVGDLVTKADDPQQHIFDKLIHNPPAQDVWDVPDAPARSYGIILEVNNKHGLMKVFWHNWSNPYCISNIRQNAARELKLLNRT